MASRAENRTPGAVRVDFYLAENRDPVDVAVLLVAKAWPAHRSLAICAPQATLDELDSRLWQQAGRFLPHGTNPTAPIRLLADPPPECDLLIQLHASSNRPAGRYRRVLEIVAADEPARASARQRFRDWKADGAEVHHHKI